MDDKNFLTPDQIQKINAFSRVINRKLNSEKKTFDRLFKSKDLNGTGNISSEEFKRIIEFDLNIEPSE